jgi:hypothetical protein
MTDADAWLPLTPEERRNLALANLAEIYNGQVDTKDGSVINVYDLIMSTSDAVWSARNSTGDAKFLPGQFTSRFEAARRPEGSVYFAGEHLSRHHTWIAGALESAWETVSSIIGPTAQLGPLDVVVDSFVSVSKMDEGHQNNGVKRPVVLINGPDGAVLEGTRLAGDHLHLHLHLGERERGGSPDIDFVPRLRRQFFAFDDLEKDSLAQSDVEFARIPGPHGVKVRRI